MNIFTEAPLWIWPLLAGLVVVGLGALRERRVPTWMIYALPVLVVLALRSVAGLQPALPGWAVFAVVWVGSALVGYRLANRWVIARTDGHVRLRGEALTLVALMLIFWANFAAGVLDAVAPAALHSAIGVGAFAGLLAAASGQFAGRALWIARRT
ncbi:hypothetical protein KUL25_09900 [Rhodobacteraceae bacterium N5(2021)]|uniref:DUF1453 domain-containing protein n=1 Tax=Gymnodinialimonas phycosphaerae TaxID=2841589 RepID=A0A975TYW5_9RHOB|nr:hypothetical protein [Gymnodinialimonas phycosphaerae]MBY4893076.1 hypothetical protein [Gymnodinialimonas phycosphaerae]